MNSIIESISEEEFEAKPFAHEPFEPVIYDVVGVGTIYADGRMTAAVDITPDHATSSISISTWDCEFVGHGYSRVALQWLRERFNHISVVGAGEMDEDGVGDISTVYWQHMLGRGLVDSVFLDDGSELAPEAHAAPGAMTA